MSLWNCFFSRNNLAIFFSDEDEESGEKSEQSDDYNKGQIKVVVAEDSKKATAANSHRSRASTVAGASRSLRLRGRPHDKQVQTCMFLSAQA